MESLTDLLSGYSRQLNGDIEKQNAVMKLYLVSINQRIERLEEEMTRRISVQRSNCGPYMTTTGSSQTISPSPITPAIRPHNSARNSKSSSRCCLYSIWKRNRNTIQPAFLCLLEVLMSGTTGYYPDQVHLKIIFS